MSFPRLFASLVAIAVIIMPAVFVGAQEAATDAATDTPRLQLQYEHPAHTVIPATSPLRRTSSADSRLTCDDYSMSYFNRHPAMAEVCNVSPEEISAALNPPAAPSPTTPHEAPGH